MADTLTPKKLRRFLYWLTLDWIHLHHTLPTPTANPDGSRRSPSREYGHPAEWASDTTRRIVDILTSWHDMVAEHRGETRPRRKRMGLNADGNDVWEYAVNEKQRLAAAYRYIEPRCEQLFDLAPIEALQEIPDLHNKIRARLGHTRPKYTLSIPCPNSECGLLTLMRIVGVGQDFVSCESCGYTIRETYYPLLIRMTLDTLLQDGD